MKGPVGQRDRRTARNRADPIGVIRCRLGLRPPRVLRDGRSAYGRHFGNQVKLGGLLLLALILPQL